VFNPENLETNDVHDPESFDTIDVDDPEAFDAIDMDDPEDFEAVDADDNPESLDAIENGMEKIDLELQRKRLEATIRQ